jgi:hypothetical protein
MKIMQRDKQYSKLKFVESNSQEEEKVDSRGKDEPEEDKQSSREKSRKRDSKRKNKHY